MLDALLASCWRAGRVDLVLSDMAPNMSGVESWISRGPMDLAELALDFARQVLRPGGTLVVKLFQGEGFQELLGGRAADFGLVRMRKPSASRQRSPETYLVARNPRL